MTQNTDNSHSDSDRFVRKKADPAKISSEITRFDVKAFETITSLELTPEQAERITTPLEIHPEQETVLAVHWHPEHIPMNLIRQRIEATFPNKSRELIIPTQHNRLMSYDGVYSGVEVDCYSRGFKRKVQLLLHFRSDRLKAADRLKSILEHTYKYRAGQMFQLMDTLVDPQWEDYRQLAAEGTGVDEEVVRFAGIHTGKLRCLLEQRRDSISSMVIKNRLVKDFFQEQMSLYPEEFVSKVLVFVRAVKRIVKKNFSLDYFFRTSEIIEEARHIGGGIIVPHPEQFWPILLCEYDVDGYEVWNPQSLEFTEFLVNVINRQNKSRSPSRKKLLLFISDDTHMSEKIKDPTCIDASKYYRDIGLQPAWEDLSIRQSLITGNFNREKMIEEYTDRL